MLLFHVVLAWARGGRQGVRLRYMFAIGAAFVLAQCANARAERDLVFDRETQALVIIGVAKAARATYADYQVLWRRVRDETGAFESAGDRDNFELETNAAGSLRVPGVPGEFYVLRVAPGAYALDSVFARMSERRVVYIAQGVVLGPERPAFQVQTGEAVYLGLWEASVEGGAAQLRPWRLDAADMEAVAAQAGAAHIELTLRETERRAVACTPQRMGAYSQRQVC